MSSGIRVVLSALFVLTCFFLAGCDDETGSKNEGDEDTIQALPDVQLDTGVRLDVPADTGGGDLNGDLGSDTGAASDTAGSDSTANTDTAADSEDDTGTSTCYADLSAYTGVLVEDLNPGPLEINDEVRVTVEIFATAAAETAGTLELIVTNVRTHESTFRLDGQPVAGVVVSGPRITIPLPSIEPGVFTFEGSPTSLAELVTVFASITLEEGGCTVHRSGSGALLQVAAGHTKTSFCVDMSEVRSLQVAPSVPLQNTQAYLDANGLRDDIEARGFIFCPQSPTVVHTTDFCLNNSLGQEISVAGSYRADAFWEVDDFILFEALDNAGVFRDGFTSQSHSGGSTFWCDDEGALMCESGCTAELVRLADDRQIPPIAVVSAEGADARRHIDGAVVLDDVITDGAFYGTMRVTALDQGVEGTLSPALYLISAEP